MPINYYEYEAREKGFSMFETDRTMFDIIKCKSYWNCLECKKWVSRGDLNK